ncbi:hypothetical protein T484DRAFT_1928220 [Baffinella frigidus]|nr:hypothetical protein T484DRAFT_1928220 [Cryptophyta sp. CCMP2293]
MATGNGALLEVRLEDGVWYRGRLVERVAGTKPPRWRVQFDNGDTRSDIRLGDPLAPVRFDAGTYGATVEVRLAYGEWYRGKLVELVRGSEQWGVAFEDGDWAEDVRLGDPGVRFTGAGSERGVKRGRVPEAGDGGSDEPRKSLVTEGKGTETGRSEEGGRATDDIEHSGERPHVCETCGKTFSRRDHLTRHMRLHSGERPHVCETCGKAFFDSGNLAVHMRSHSGERPYTCETCGKTFSHSGTLVVHMRTHSGDRPFACELCGKSFANSGNLTKHLRTHSRERPHACDTCGKAFKTPGSLASHMRTHAGEKPNS